MFHRHCAGVEEDQDNHEPKPSWSLTNSSNKESEPLFILPELWIGTFLGRGSFTFHWIGFHTVRFGPTQFLHFFRGFLTSFHNEFSVIFCSSFLGQNQVLSTTDPLNIPKLQFTQTPITTKQASIINYTLNSGTTLLHSFLALNHLKPRLLLLLLIRRNYNGFSLLQMFKWQKLIW